MYELTTFYIIAMEFFLLLTIVKILKFSNVENPAINRAYLVFGSWLVSVIVLLGVFKILPSDISSIELFSIVLIGVVLSGVFFYLLKDEFLSLPQELLLLPQAFRMFFGAGFIIEAVYEIMPIGYGGRGWYFTHHNSLFVRYIGRLCC